ncbi:MAG: alpha/beta hydrolase [Planctomycetota bacterium]|nr:alpha/beta hydrolase [Planctomycetaceae bacterium]MDQ3330145.1 alpha/beta hydrolase [Planctomycetota bacterium]
MIERWLIVLASALVFLPIAAPAQEDKPKTVQREEDVIYGRKYGTALTLDVFRPESPNGVGIIHVVSGGWYSAHEAINQGFVQPFLDRGYTVFAVVHGSQPKYTIPEVLEDMHRAVRYIRHHAKDYDVDPEKLGIYGGSAGGHLSLMQGTAGNDGNAQAKDEIDRESSRVAAVACFFPPTDFLNYGKEGEVAIGGGTLKDFRAPFDFHELMPNSVQPGRKGTFVPITDEAKVLAIAKAISPKYHASSDDPPTLIIHGNADFLVPIQQAELMVEALKTNGVEAELVVREGAGHGWAKLGEDLTLFGDWFDKHLRGAETKEDAKEK